MTAEIAESTCLLCGNNRLILQFLCDVIDSSNYSKFRDGHLLASLVLI